MTEIQKTNIAVANFIIGELHKDKPFNLVLDAGETGALYHIASESHHLHSNFVRKLEATLKQRVNNGTGVILELSDSNAVAIPNDSYEFREKYLADYNSSAAYDSRSWPDKALYELLGFAQHYGYPTELLDWSYSPLVASYFAASGVISNRESSLDGYMSVWVFDLEKKNPLNDHKKTNFEVINIPRSLNLNISSQQGCFTLVRQDINRNQKITYSNKRIQEMKLLPDLMAEKRQNGLLKLTVSNKNSLEILEFCDSYSINAASLFRGPYGAAQYAIEGINKNRFASKNSLSINGSIPL